jgi:prepilin-type N-terminal cleavage/methylation domain-containing protein
MPESAKTGGTLQNMNHSHEKGFTLIEVMLVFVIIGILAAIAIPNYISFRSRSFCSTVESDAMTVAQKVFDYYAIPTHTTGLPTLTDLKISPSSLSNSNSAVISGNINGTISIVVTDGRSQCPTDYRRA